MKVKRLLLYFTTFAILGTAFFLIHNNYIVKNNYNLDYNLDYIYIFHGTSSLIICILFELGSYVKKVSHQLGFIYLATIVIKLAIFSGIFYNDIFTQTLNTYQQISLLIPMAIFLITEVFFVAKILNRTFN